MRLVPASARALLLAGVAACSNDWSALDPRLGEGGATSAGGSGATGGLGTAGDSAGAAGGQGGMGNIGVGGASVGGLGGAGGTGGVPTQTVSYPATVADCIDPALPNPGACGTADSFTVDTLNGMGLAIGYVRFDLDDTFLGTAVIDVMLTLTVTDDENADSRQTGEVFEVEAFTLMSLGTQAPALVGSDPIGADQGPVVQLDVVEWSLPTDLVAPSGSVYLGLLPLLDDGVDYYDIDGAGAPVLTITYR